MASIKEIQKNEKKLYYNFLSVLIIFKKTLSNSQLNNLKNTIISNCICDYHADYMERLYLR